MLLLRMWPRGLYDVIFGHSDRRSNKCNMRLTVKGCQLFF